MVIYEPGADLAAVEEALLSLAFARGWRTGSGPLVGFWMPDNGRDEDSPSKSRPGLKLPGVRIRW